MQMFQKQMIKALFETLSAQLCCGCECKFACSRFTFGADVGKAEGRNGNVGVVGCRDEATEHDFFGGREFSVREFPAAENADVAEAAAHFFVAAGMEYNFFIASFPPECWPVRDVAIVCGEGGVDGVEGERNFTGSFALLRMTHGCRTALVSRLSSLV